MLVSENINPRLTLPPPSLLNRVGNVRFNKIKTRAILTMYLVLVAILYHQF
jgi:hypothetical protein